MSYIITGVIQGIGTGSGTNLSIPVIWQIQPAANGITGGNEPFEVPPDLTDIEIEAEVRAQIAAKATLLSGVNFTAADVFGCKF